MASLIRLRIQPAQPRCTTSRTKANPSDIFSSSDGFCSASLFSSFCCSSVLLVGDWAISRSRMAKKNWMKNFDRKSSRKLSFSVILLRSALISLMIDEKNGLKQLSTNVFATFPRLSLVSELSLVSAPDLDPPAPAEPAPPVSSSFIFPRLASFFFPWSSTSPAPFP